MKDSERPDAAGRAFSSKGDAPMDDDKRLSYFFLGIGLGVAAGILFAPKAGDETRRLLRDKADEGKDYIRRRGEEFRSQATETAESVLGRSRETAESILERGRETLARQRDSFSAALDAGREAYRDANGRGPSEV
jgi:gas vesicle protein